MNNDTYLDVVVRYTPGSHTNFYAFTYGAFSIYLYTNNGTQVFSQRFIYNSGYISYTYDYCYSIYITDLNRDGLYGYYCRR